MDRREIPPHGNINLACWIINLLLDVLLCNIAENSLRTRCLYFDSPYRTTRKNTQQYYTTKSLIRHLSFLEYFSQHAQFYLGNIQSRDGFKPVAFEWMYLKDYKIKRFRTTRPGARFSKFPVTTGPIKLFCFPFQIRISKGLRILL